MWIEPPQPTQAQRDKGNAMAARILEIHRAKQESVKDEYWDSQPLTTDDLSEEELRAYVNNLID